MRALFQGRGAEAHGLHLALVWLVNDDAINTVVVSETAVAGETTMAFTCVDGRTLYARLSHMYPVDLDSTTIVGHVAQEELKKVTTALARHLGLE